MPNVLPSAELALSLERLNLVVWEAKRQNKSSPTAVTVAGPDLDYMLYGVGMTIEEAVDRALKTPQYVRERRDLTGAIARLDRALYDLWLAIWSYRQLFVGEIDDLDDFVPF